MNTIIKVRNAIISFIYRRILKPIYFCFDPEFIHDRMTVVGKFLGKFAFTRALTKTFFYYSNPKLEQTVCGIKFSNPIGLSAGFDKNAELTDILPSVGFGFEEIGSITGEPCPGNPKPRLWRLKRSQSLAVYYGLKNDGAVAIANRLRNKKFSAKGGPASGEEFPIGVSIAKTNSPATVDTDAGINDYVKAYRELKDLGSYFTINISCPNAYGGQPFTNVERLEKLLTAIDGERILSPALSTAVEREALNPLRRNGGGRGRTVCPIFLKLSPDLNTEDLDLIVAAARRHRIAGFICANLTKNRQNEKIIDQNIPAQGGLSGKVVEELADDALSYLYKKYGREFILIGVGGVFNAEDAYKKIKNGATLIQLITGLIFEGPQVISEINRGLVELLEKDGYKNISEAVGKDVLLSLRA